MAVKCAAAELWWVIEPGGGRVVLVFSLSSGQGATGKNSQTKAGETQQYLWPAVAVHGRSFV